jgi:SAM-dependent methyltransferase
MAFGLGLGIRTKWHNWRQHQRELPYSQFLPLKETLKNAEAAGLAVGDYIDRRYWSDTTGHGATPTQQTINNMVKIGIFSGPLERVTEIGPGSGRYLEKVMQRAHPAYYEIYETATDWRHWLKLRYPCIVVQPCDGLRLSATDDASIDLVQAHKVFIGVPFFAIVSYFYEMSRVVRPGGWVVFDVLTENCLCLCYRKAWFDAHILNWNWAPAIMPKQFAIDLFAEHGCAFVDSFLILLLKGRVTECLIFRKP